MTQGERSPTQRFGLIWLADSSFTRCASMKIKHLKIWLNLAGRVQLYPVCIDEIKCENFSTCINIDHHLRSFKNNTKKFTMNTHVRGGYTCRKTTVDKDTHSVEYSQFLTVPYSTFASYCVKTTFSYIISLFSAC